MPCFVIQLLQSKPTKCTRYNFIYKSSSTCFGPRRSIIRKSVVEYKHWGITLCLSMYGIMVNYPCVLYTE